MKQQEMKFTHSELPPWYMLDMRRSLQSLRTTGALSTLERNFPDIMIINLEDKEKFAKQRG